jgi:hypothetical protein
MADMSKDDKRRAERRALRVNRGHNPEEHKEKDAVRSKGKASEESKERYRKTVQLFTEYVSSIAAIDKIYVLTWLGTCKKRRICLKTFKLGRDIRLPASKS